MKKFQVDEKTNDKELKTLIKTEGLFLVQGLLTKDEIDQLKNVTLKYCKTNGLKDHGGIAVPDFLSINAFNSINWIKDHSKIHKYLKILLEDDYRLCSHNDIALNRVNYEWHKDILEKRWESYQKADLWKELDGQKYNIIKVLIYCQDHTKDDHALKIIPKSHLESGKHSISEQEVKGRGFRLHPKVGDVLFFDSRMTHKGQDSQDSKDRILVTMTFGKNNIFTNEYESGIIARQTNHKNKILNKRKIFRRRRLDFGESRNKRR